MKSFGLRISPFLRDDSTVKLRVSRYLDWLSLTFTIIYTCIIMTHRTTGSLSEYQLLRTSHKLRNYCIHRSTTVERLQVQVPVYINIEAVTAGLHADNLHVGIFSMQEWHLFQENSKKITLPIHHNYHHPTVSIRPSYLRIHWSKTGLPTTLLSYIHTSHPPPFSELPYPGKVRNEEIITWCNSKKQLAEHYKQIKAKPLCTYFLCNPTPQGQTNH